MHKILAAKPEGKRPLCDVWEGKRNGWGGMGFCAVGLNRDRWRGVVNTAVNVRIPYKSASNLTASATVSV
jgi:hypothetical protein